MRDLLEPQGQVLALERLFSLTREQIHRADVQRAVRCYPLTQTHS